LKATEIIKNGEKFRAVLYAENSVLFTRHFFMLLRLLIERPSQELGQKSQLCAFIKGFAVTSVTVQKSALPVEALCVMYYAYLMDKIIITNMSGTTALTGASRRLHGSIA
jgi:hypothetical protein